MLNDRIHCSVCNTLLIFSENIPDPVEADYECPECKSFHILEKDAILKILHDETDKIEKELEISLKTTNPARLFRLLMNLRENLSSLGDNPTFGRDLASEVILNYQSFIYFEITLRLFLDVEKNIS